MSSIYHRHHIVPMHMGGTDDPSNLVTITIEEHAEAHRILYQKYGKEEDLMAWLGLSGQASKQEITILGAKLGRLKTNKILEERYGPDWAHIQSKNASNRLQEKLKNDMDFMDRFIGKLKNNQPIAVEAAKSLESRKKKKETFRKIQHQQGSKNSNYGKIWISNETLKLSKTHPKSDPIPDGWYKGRRFIKIKD